jgi:hypothetical protein
MDRRPDFCESCDPFLSLHSAGIGHVGLQFIHTLPALAPHHPMRGFYSRRSGGIFWLPISKLERR